MELFDYGFKVALNRINIVTKKTQLRTVFNGLGHWIEISFSKNMAVVN